MRRLCYKMISYNIHGRGKEPEKVIATNIFYLHSMDRRAANVSYLLAQYSFRQAEGMKSGARLSRGHFIGRLAHYFGLAVSAPIHAPPPPPPAAERSMTDQDRFSTWMISCMMPLMEASECTYQAFVGTFRGSFPAVFERRTRQRTDNASTSTAQQQPDL
nr:hypothetical protein [Tanacetum cinerariifolium]